MIEAALANDIYISLVLNKISSFTLIYIFCKIIFLCALLFLLLLFDTIQKEKVKRKFD